MKVLTFSFYFTLPSAFFILNVFAMFSTREHARPWCCQGEWNSVTVLQCYSVTVTEILSPRKMAFIFKLTRTHKPFEYLSYHNSLKWKPWFWIKLYKFAQIGSGRCCVVHQGAAVRLFWQLEIRDHINSCVIIGDGQYLLFVIQYVETVRNETMYYWKKYFPSLLFISYVGQNHGSHPSCPSY